MIDRELLDKSRDFDGVVVALTLRNAEFDDRIADIYKDLWELATEPASFVAGRRVDASERNLSVEARRHAKALRRLGTLAFVDGYVQPLLNAEQDSDPRNTQPSLPDLYRDSLSQIAIACGVDSSEIEERKLLLQANPSARPWFMR